MSNSATLWTLACQASLPMELSRQGYCSELPSLLQGVFLTQGLNHISCISCTGPFTTFTSSNHHHNSTQISNQVLFSNLGLSWVKFETSLCMEDKEGLKKRQTTLDW